MLGGSALLLGTWLVNVQLFVTGINQGNLAVLGGAVSEGQAGRHGWMVGAGVGGRASEAHSPCDRDDALCHLPA